MDKRQDKRLPQASWSPDHLAEEVYLPERIDVGLKELVPGPRTTLGTRLDALFLEDVLDSGLRYAADTQFSEFSENPDVSPARLFSKTDDDLADRFQSSGSAHLLGLLAAGFFADPTLVGPLVDDRNELRRTWTYGSAQFEQPLSLVPLEEDSLLGYPDAEHLVLSLVKLVLPAQFVLGAAGQVEQKWRKPACHVMAPYVTDEVEIEDDNLFTLLESANGRSLRPLEMPIGDRLGQSMKFGDNCAG